MRCVVGGQRLERPDECPEEFFRILARCWEAKPERRPSFKELCEKVGKVARKLGGNPHLRDFGALVKRGPRTTVAGTTHL
jgi:hypothetical protein